MIKLKSILENINSLDKEKEKDAVFYIKKAWENLPKEDRYSTDQVRLFLENDEYIWRKIEEISPKYFPDSDEPAYEFTKYVTEVLEKLEAQKTKKVLKKMDLNDPLYQIKKIIKGKSWEVAKKSLDKTDLSNRMHNNNVISDDDAEHTFNRLYRIAMGETMYDLSDDNVLPYLNSIYKNQDNEYINTFINRYVGKNAEKFPEKVTVFRGTSTPNSKIRPGDYVTLDREYARDYVRGNLGSIISDVIPTSDLKLDSADIGVTKLIYWPKGHKIKPVGNVPSLENSGRNLND